jgi:hypothetical protein
MNGRRRRIRILRGDILVTALLTGGSLCALLRWPDQAVADVAIPVALLILFIEWRRQRQRWSYWRASIRRPRA